MFRRTLRVFKDTTKKGFTIPERLSDMGPAVHNPRPFVQDMPPPGGFPAFRIRKNTEMFSKWKPSTYAIIIGIIMIYGWKRLYSIMQHRRVLEEEQVTLERVMIPFLQAEHDIAFTVRKRAFMKKVEELMKDDPNFDVNEHFYNNKEFFQYPLYHMDLAVFKGTGLLKSEQKK